MRKHLIIAGIICAASIPPATAVTKCVALGSNTTCTARQCKLQISTRLVYYMQHKWQKHIRPRCQYVQQYRRLFLLYNGNPIRSIFYDDRKRILLV